MQDERRRQCSHLSSGVPEELVAADARHPEVGYDEIKRVSVGELLESERCVCRCDDLMAFEFEQQLKAVQNFWMVIDDKNLHSTSS